MITNAAFAYTHRVTVYMTLLCLKVLTLVLLTLLVVCYQLAA